LSSLTVLDLTNNSITSIPPSAACISNLQRLYIGNNKLVSLPDGTVGKSGLPGVIAVIAHFEEAQLNSSIALCLFLITKPSNYTHTYIIYS